VRRQASAPRITVSLLGPAIMGASAVWMLAQPYRLTLLHPRGEGFWWLLIEPQLLLFVAGLAFSVLVAPGLLEDLERHESERDDR
jgi:hypothetical protein